MLGTGTIVAHHVLNCAINWLLDYLFLMNKQFIPDEKWKLFYSKQLEMLPGNFEQRIHQSLLVGEFNRQELQRRQSVFIPLALDALKLKIKGKKLWLLKR